MDPMAFYEDTQERKRRMLPQALGLMSPDGVLTNNVQPGRALPMTMRQRLAKVGQELDTLESGDVDTSQFQAFAKQQGEQGQAAMLNALAAQYAGESFQPVQGQFLKRAMAAQEPMKIGTGVLTPDGQYIKDPFAARDSRRASLERQYGQLASDIERTERYERERAEKLRQDERDYNLRVDNLNLRRDMVNNRQGDESKNWRNEDNLRKDFDTLTKDLREQLAQTNTISQIISATPPGQKPDAITQQSLVILLNKFLDPGSVVREGEFDRVVKAQGLAGRASNLADRILKGQPLDANTIQQINGLAQLYTKAAEAKINSIAKNYTEIANKRNLDVGSVISDPRFRGAAAGDVPAGVEPALWAAMTPQERALWQKKP